jgi:TonB-dependent receptor
METTMEKVSTRAGIVHPTRCASAVATVLALLSGQGALAQDTAPAAGATARPAADQPAAVEDGSIAVVQIAGTRQSVASAIDRKLRASTVVDSIVAEDIGQFPDKNVGEALSRITGVQLSRDFGEGSKVSIRGVEPDLNRIEINGMSMLGTDGTAGRGAELRELASELVGSIDVYKGITADMTEGGVGGTVVIRTRKPLDFKKPTLGGTLSGEHSTSRGGVQPRVNLYAADKYLDGKLGLMANVVYDKVLTQNDYARNTSWYFLRDWDNSPAKTVTSTDPAVAAVTDVAGCSSTSLTSAQQTACRKQWYDYNPGTARYGLWTRDHKRSSAEVTAQYQFSKELSAWVSYQDNTQKQRLNDRNFGTSFSALNRLATTSATGSCTTPSTTPESMEITNHVVTSYTVGDCLASSGQGGNAAFGTSARDFKLDVKSSYATSGFNFKRERLEVEGLFGTSRSRYHNETNNISLTQNAPGLTVTLDDQGIPHFTFPAGYSPDDAASYTQVQLQYRPYETRNTEDQAKLDFKYRLSSPFFTKLWFGVQGRNSGAKKYGGGGYVASGGANSGSTADDVNVMSGNVNQTIVYNPLSTTVAASTSSPYASTAAFTSYVNAATMASMVSSILGTTPGAFFNGYSGLSGLPTGWSTPVYANATQYFDTSLFKFDNIFSALGSDGNTYAQIPSYDLKEKIASSYLRLDYGTTLFGFEVDGNFGVRYTRTSNRSAGLSQYKVRVANSAGSSTYTDYTVSSTQASVASTYHDVLPSFNGTVWFIDNKLLARVGWAKAMARPNIDLLAPTATCTLNSGNEQFGGEGADDCSAGNPNLKPYRSTNTDLSFEYYPSQDTQLSLALFRKDISSYIRTGVVTKDVDLFGNGQLFDVTRAANGEGAITQGIELTARTALTFLPGWLGGLGVDTNYTRMSYKYSAGNELVNTLDGSVLSYPGMSKNAYNASLWYDRGPVNARLSYTYRDRFYTGGTDVSGNPTYQEKTGFLDAKLQYRLNDHVTFSVEGKNLTDQAQTTDSGSMALVNEIAWPGRRYFFSVSVKL